MNPPLSALRPAHRLNLVLLLCLAVAVRANDPNATAAPPPAHVPAETATAEPAREETVAEHTNATLTDETLPGDPAASSQPPAPAAEPVKPENHKLAPIPTEEEKVKEARGLIVLGTTLTERGDYQAAEIAFRRILSTRAYGTPAQKDALLGIARMYRRAGNYTKAAAIYEKFLKTFPNESRVPDALLELGRTLRAMGAYKLAINRFYSVINSALKLPAEGFDHYQLLAKTAQFEIAETHFEAGNYTEAGKYFARLRLLDLASADRARAHFKSAYALLLADEKENAVNTLRDFLSDWPTDENVPEARALLATTLRQLERREDAMNATLDLLRAEQAASSADPKRWSYWQRRTGNQLANEFFETGDTMYALAIYQSLAKLSTDPLWQLPVTYQIALCYERLRLTDRARATYKILVDAGNSTATGQSAITPEIQELARMASWRLGHLDWTQKTDQQLNVFFNTTTGQAHPKPGVLPSPQ